MDIKVVLVSIIPLLLTAHTALGKCPPWTTQCNTTHCKCGDSLRGTVDCNKETLNSSVLRCYCISYNQHVDKYVVGRCLATCALYLDDHQSGVYYGVPQANTSNFDEKICSNVSRKGQLCGQCIDGYGPPVYSYSFRCVRCDEKDFKYNLLKYIAIAFIPLTGFYLIVIIFKVRLTSNTIFVAYILTCQIFSAPFPSRYMLRSLESRPHMTNMIYFKIIIAFFAIWNLDIFRSVYPPFCIHPGMTTIHALALDYLVGVYPLSLIVITYIAVVLHDRYPLIVKIWRPVNKLCMCIRREWNIRGSLIEAFATFLVLSYVKILNVSFDLLIWVTLKTPDGGSLNQTYLYNAGEVPYFGQEHRPYGILAIVMLLVFNILPMLLLFLYPCSCFHNFLNYCHLHSFTLYTLMDTFQGCYHHKPKERRCFAALYLLARIVQLVLSLIFKDMLSYLIVTTIYFISLGLVLIFFKPYKKEIQNTIDAALFLWYAMGYILVISYMINPQPIVWVSSLSFIIFFLVLLIYFVVAAVAKIIPKRIVGRCKSWNFRPKVVLWKSAQQNNSEYEKLLPYLQN